MAKIKGVFFDLGGTLRIAEEVPEHMERAKARMAELAGAEDVKAFIDMVEERYAPYRDWALTENRECGDFDLWHKWLLPEMAEDKLREICHELTFQYRQVKGLRHLVEGGREVIETLHKRGYKLSIISNLIGEYEIGDWLRADGLEQYFDAVVLSSVCGIRKPDPRIFEHGVKSLGILPEQTLVIGDSLRKDIEPAESLGCQVLWIKGEGWTKEEDAQTHPNTIYALEEAKAILL